MRQVIKRQDRSVAPVWPGPGPTRDGAPRLDWSSDGWWLSAHPGPVSISLCHGLVTGTDPHVSVTPPCHVTLHPNITWSLHQTMAITISQKARWSNTDNGGFIIVCPNIVWSWLGKFEWGKSPTACWRVPKVWRYWGWWHQGWICSDMAPGPGLWAQTVSPGRPSHQPSAELLSIINTSNNCATITSSLK